MVEMQAVRFGDIDELEPRTVPRPAAEAGRVVAKAEAAGIDAGEAVDP